LFTRTPATGVACAGECVYSKRAARVDHSAWGCAVARNDIDDTLRSRFGDEARV
jgi:hypothetical protein